MRTSQANHANGVTVHRTIDLTAPSPRVTTAIRRERAQAAFRASRRRRVAVGSIDAVADAAVASGGLLIANASLHLNLGLPGGLAGTLSGIGLLCIGAAIAVSRRGRSGGTDPATEARQVVINLDEPAPRVISLEVPEHTAA